MIVLDNALIQAGLSCCTKREQKLLAGILDKIPKDTMSQITLNVNDLCTILGYNRRSVWVNAKSVVNRLKDRTININDIQCQIFHNLEYNQGLLIATVNPQLAPYLINLNNKFTKISKNNCLHFKSKYTLPLYQRLLMAKNMSTVTISVDEIRALLRTNPKQEYWQLKHRIIIPALDEINTVLDVDYIPIRRGRKVVALQFIFGITRISKKVNNKKKSIDTNAVQDLTSEGINSHVARALVDKYGDKYVQDKLALFRAYRATHDIHNPAAYLVHAIKADLWSQTPAEKAAKEAKQAKRAANIAAYEAQKAAAEQAAIKEAQKYLGQYVDNPRIAKIQARCEAAAAASKTKKVGRT